MTIDQPKSITLKSVSLFHCATNICMHRLQGNTDPRFHSFRGRKSCWQHRHFSTVAEPRHSWCFEAELCSGQTRIFLSGNSLFHLENRGLGPPVGHICCAFVALTWCLSAGYKTLPFLRAFEPILKES